MTKLCFELFYMSLSIENDIFGTFLYIFFCAKSHIRTMFFFLQNKDINHSSIIKKKDINLSTKMFIYKIRKKKIQKRILRNSTFWFLIPSKKKTFWFYICLKMT